MSIRHSVPHNTGRAWEAVSTTAFSQNISTKIISMALRAKMAETAGIFFGAAFEWTVLFRRTTRLLSKEISIRVDRGIPAYFFPLSRLRGLKLSIRK